MSEAPTLVWVAAAGALLGVFFFGGLWWTVQRSVAAKQPALWFAGSLVLRLSVVLSGFYVISDRRWERLLLCLLGFVVARAVLTRASAWSTRTARQSQASEAQRAGHAP